jgi:ABC-type amino acid transport system permease subunit
MGLPIFTYVWIVAVVLLLVVCVVAAVARYIISHLRISRYVFLRQSRRAYISFVRSMGDVNIILACSVIREYTHGLDTTFPSRMFIRVARYRKSRLTSLQARQLLYL